MALNLTSGLTLITVWSIMHQEEMKGPTGVYYPRLLPGGGGVLPMMAYAGRLRPERGIFFKLEVYERVGKSVVCYCERAQKG